MSYIWINPVTEAMYDKELLDKFLKKHGFTRFYADTDWIEVVKDNYRDVMEMTENVVIDVRCPKSLEMISKELINTESLDCKVVVPHIYPILIHCAIEGSMRRDLEDKDKIITTPCKALADMGNKLGLKDTVFVTWNDFFKEIKEYEDLNCDIDLKQSPIPLGFFDGLGVKTLSLSGRKEIEEYIEGIKNNNLKETVYEEDIVEILYCKDGCHNGDGVRNTSFQQENSYGK